MSPVSLNAPNGRNTPSALWTAVCSTALDTSGQCYCTPITQNLYLVIKAAQQMDLVGCGVRGIHCSDREIFGYPNQIQSGAHHARTPDLIPAVWDSFFKSETRSKMEW